MNGKRQLEEDTNESNTKKAKVQISNDKDIHISEEMEKEIKLLNINYPINLEEIKAKKILHKASRNDCVNVLLEVLKLNKLTINERDLNGSTPLHLAAQNGHTRIVAELLAHGADIELPKGNKYTKFRCQIHNCGTSALHLASEYGHVEVLKELLKYKPDLSKGDKRHYNALQIACKKGHLDIVKELLLNGANILENHFEPELLPIFIAVSKNNFPIFEELIKHGADPFQFHFTSMGSITGIEKAEFTGQLEMVEYVLVNFDDADIDYGWTRLHNASFYGCINAVSRLLEKGAKIDAVTDLELQTPLHVAIDSSKRETVNKLLQHGANVNIQDFEGNTALHTVLQGMKKCILYKCQGKYKCDPENYAKIMESLLFVGKDIDLNIRNKEGKTVLQMAIVLSFENEFCAKVARMIVKKSTKSRISDSIYPLQRLLGF